MDGGTKKSGTWPSFPFPGSGGVIVELYADRDQAVSVGRCRLGMSAVTRVTPVNVLVSLGNGVSSAETQ